jgi:amino acid transporter
MNAVNQSLIDGPTGAAASKALKPDALGLASGVVVGLASTAPAYSLAAALGPIILAAGLQAPAVVLLAFLPTLCVAIACQQLNRFEPNCGTSFIWTARALGPRVGWLCGWAMIATDVIVLANMAQIAGQYGGALIGLAAPAHVGNATTLTGVLWILVMTGLCYLGIEMSLKTQCVLLLVEILVLLVFAAIALGRVYDGAGSTQSIQPAWYWFDPLALPRDALASGVLLAVFMYWGWDTALAVNEETSQLTRTPGRAALLSMVVLLCTYILVTVAALAFGGVDPPGGTPARADEGAGDSLLRIGGPVLRAGLWSKLLMLSVLSSALASMLTTVLAAARALLSMARARALPAVLERIHPRYLTPTVATLVSGLISALYFAGMSLLSTDWLADSIDAIACLVAFYYALTAFACVWKFRGACTATLRDFLRMGCLPLLGGVFFSLVLVTSAFDLAALGHGKSAFAGVGGAFVVAAGALVLGGLLVTVRGLAGADYLSGHTLGDPASSSLGSPPGAAEQGTAQWR